MVQKLGHCFYAKVGDRCIDKYHSDSLTDRVYTDTVPGQGGEKS